MPAVNNTAALLEHPDDPVAIDAAKVCVKRAPIDGLMPPEARPVAFKDGNASKGKAAEMTALQKHCAYFDRDGDGYISPWDTYSGCRAIGFGVLMSAFMTSIINTALAPPTVDGPIWYPTPYINLKNVHRSKHGSDSGIYDETGRFVPAHFDAWFSKYDLDRDDALSWGEFKNRSVAQRVVFDPFGYTATFLEWGFTYLLAGEGSWWNGTWKLPKHVVKGVFDGSLFENIEADLKAKKQAKIDEKAAKKKAKQEERAADKSKSQ